MSIGSSPHRRSLVHPFVITPCASIHYFLPVFSNSITFLVDEIDALAAVDGAGAEDGEVKVAEEVGDFTEAGVEGGGEAASAI